MSETAKALRRDGESPRVTLKNSQNKSQKSKQSTVARTDGESSRVTLSNKTRKFLKLSLKMSKVKTIHCSGDGRGVFQGDPLQQNQKN